MCVFARAVSCVHPLCVCPPCVLSFEGAFMPCYLCHAFSAATLSSLSGFPDSRLWRPAPAPHTSSEWAPSPQQGGFGSWPHCIPAILFSQEKCLEITPGWDCLHTGGAVAASPPSHLVPLGPFKPFPPTSSYGRCNQLGGPQGCTCPSIV